MTEDYLKPEKIHTIYMPSRTFYIMDGGNNLNKLDYRFNYDDEAEKIGLEGVLYDEKVYQSSISLTRQEMEEKIVRCLDEAIELPEIDDINKAMKEIIDEVFSNVGQEKVIEINTKHDLKDVQAFVTKEVEGEKRYIYMLNTLSYSANDSYGEEKSIRGTILEMLPILAEETCNKMIKDGDNINIEVRSQEGFKYIFDNVSFEQLDETRKLAGVKLLTGGFRAESITMEIIDDKDKLEVKKIPEQKSGGGARLGTIVNEGKTQEFIKEVKEMVGETSEEKKKKSKSKGKGKTKNRFKEII